LLWVEGNIDNPRLHKILKKVCVKGKLRHIGLLFPGNLDQGRRAGNIGIGHPYLQLNIASAAPRPRAYQNVPLAWQHLVHRIHAFQFLRSLGQHPGIVILIFQ